MELHLELKSHRTFPVAFFVNPSYAVGVIFYDFLVFFGTLIDVFPGNVESVEFKTACSPDQVT